jgi:hypothetical protein
MICIAVFLLAPGSFPAFQHASVSILPEFRAMAWQSWLPGLVESFFWGWWPAVCNEGEDQPRGGRA